MKAIVLTGCAQDKTLFVPRITLLPSDLLLVCMALQIPIK